ncbi:excinuclease ABC subunit UvrA [Marinilabilia salmonicolor]|jgi:excinuclease ABC subunit A|uniref:UvrABC system protein A n=1 Tax=Marinilabilia salmonicolor TaxID=989 RepID=A0A2T0XAS9_9BACT|nr:excinuclease ABC subunit UvrA [Marinilabilia salmonicolor]PRY95984.1 excinuclease ABC subunit A [Marinilabilia salmonicolor]RCW29133.1 excinuclease ABC subunit A [Marinilabilia salmonicolor]
MGKTKATASKYISIKGARVHNLKNIDLDIPRNQFIIITGVSGSGKSSLAFDTLYAEGQRRYVESLSSYARQFLGRLDKPEVDYIKGIPPAIAIEQKVNTRNPRSTVGTSTEIYDYLKLLYARIGRTFSPVSGNEVKKHQVDDVIDFINQFEDGTKMAVLASIVTPADRSCADHLSILKQQGFSRVESDGTFLRIDELLQDEDLLSKCREINLVIDRISVKKEDEDNESRLADSLQTAFYEGRGECLIKIYTDEGPQTYTFSNRFEADGIVFEEPTEHTFSFNNPIGACPTCEGFGNVIGIDEDLVIPNKNLSIYDDAIACWRGEKMGEWKNVLINNAHKFDFPVHKPYYELTPEQRELLWTGNRHFYGLNKFFKHLESKQYKIQFRVMLSRYRGKTTCPDCRGTRLKKEAMYVKINGRSIHELVLMPVSELETFFGELKLNEHEQKVSKRLLIEITSRLQFLNNVGLGYLTLNRLSSTLSGGESQRINLATSLGSSLVGSLYILDEPSIGLHPRDTHLLINVLQHLKKLGNTVVVVEHDEEIIRAGDEIIDIGPRAGQNGGEVVFQGNFRELEATPDSLTTQYLNGTRKIEIPSSRRSWNNSLEIVGARENNLKNLNVKIPLNVLHVITGVSGSGKSSLVKKVLYPALKKIKGGYADKTGEFDLLKGDTKAISDVEFIDQNPIGKSSRSNPATYLKAYDEIRKLMADQKQAKVNGLKPAHFSFNVDGGRCDECQGEGTIKIEMQFMADIVLTCESCQGKRFKPEILDITYRGKNIHDILEMTVNQSIEFFREADGNTEKRIAVKLQPLADVGLGYVHLGQPSSTLSGGESQRIKLASFLAMEKTEPTLFIFDEPTTGLHFHDIQKLLKAFEALIEKGHTVLVVEHNMEIIKSADWITDLGPEGGNEGGNLVFAGKPEDLIKSGLGHTGKYLEPYLPQ